MKTDLQLLEQLVRIPSVSADIPQVNRCMDAMRDYLEAHGLACTFEEYQGRKILYSSVTPGKVQDYLLNAHLDVVPGEPELFEPRVEGDWIYGRGVTDCKGNCVAMAQILCALKGTGASVGAIFTADEEIGGATTRHMVNLGYAARKLVLVLDGPNYAIVSAEKGVLDLVLKATGKTAHSSTPWVGDNAFDKLVDAYLKLKAAWPKNAPGPDGDQWFDTMSADVIRSGDIHNKVPDHAEMLVNIRFTKPGDDVRIEKFVQDVTGLPTERGEVTIPVVCDEKSPELLRLLDIMRRKWPNRNVGFSKMNGATDARHFALSPAPIAITAAEGLHCHSPEEAAKISCIGELVDVILEFVAQ